MTRKKALLQSYRIHQPYVAYEVIEREVVAVDLRDGSYYSLSGTGKTAWLAFGADGAAVDDVVRLLATIYAVSPVAAARDLQIFIAELRARDAIVSCGAVSAAPAFAAAPPTAEPYSPPGLRYSSELHALFWPGRSRWLDRLRYRLRRARGTLRLMSSRLRP